MYFSAAVICGEREPKIDGQIDRRVCMYMYISIHASIYIYMYIYMRTYDQMAAIQASTLKQAVD